MDHSIHTRCIMDIIMATSGSYPGSITVENSGNQPRTLVIFVGPAPDTKIFLDALTTAGYACAVRGAFGTTICVEHPPMNTLVIIGYTGDRTAYLNLSEEEAKRRWLARANEGMPEDCRKTEVDVPVSIERFCDEFNVY